MILTRRTLAAGTRFISGEAVEVNPTSPLSRGLRGLWMPGVSRADLSGYGDLGTLVPTGAPPTGSPTLIGLTSSHNGSGQYFTGFQSDIGNGDSCSILTWAIPNSLGGEGTVACISNNGSGWAVRLSGSATTFKVNIVTNGGGEQGVSGSSAVANVPVALCCVFNRSTSTLYLYVDGVEYSTGVNNSDKRHDTTQATYIGCTVPGFDYYSGNIGLVAVHDRALSAAEIAQFSREPLDMVRGRRRLPLRANSAAPPPSTRPPFIRMIA